MTEFLLIVSIVGKYYICSWSMFLLKIAFVLIFMLSLKISFICISIDGDNSMKKPIVNLQIRRTWEGGQEYITRGGV